MPPATGVEHRELGTSGAFAGRLRELLRDQRQGRPPIVGRSAIVQQGDYWTIVYEIRQFQLRDSKGLRYLAQLLHHPGQEFHSLDLVVGSRGRAPAPWSAETNLGASSGDAGFVLDAAATAAYRARSPRSTRSSRRRPGTTTSAGYGEWRWNVTSSSQSSPARRPGGRNRRAASETERARQSVTKAVREAIQRISAVCPSLGTHLAATVRTGNFIAYEPDPRVPAIWD